MSELARRLDGSDMPRRVGFCLRNGAAALALALLLPVRPAAAELLGEALLENGVQPSDLPVSYAPNRLITSFAVLSEPDLFALAYYEDDGSGVLEPPLYILLRDGAAGRWQGAAINEMDAGPENRHCFGSVVAIDSAPHALYFTTHITPSASCTFVTSPDLQFQDVLYGWFLSSFSDGTIIYHDSMVHFAPTHPAHLSLYDPVTRESRTVYPLRPYQPIREAHMARLRVIYNDPAWCNRRNHHCDPASFDNSIGGTVVINDVTDSLAFVASYTQTELAAPGETPEAPTQVLYVYRNVRDADGIEYRELLLEDFRTRFGDRPIADALSPEILERLFTD
jgi:hypothetical protein